jgi:type IV pilus assembly protein PilY1
MNDQYRDCSPKTGTPRKFGTAAVAFALVFGAAFAPGAHALNLAQSPLFVVQGQAPLVMLTMSRDHKLYYEAYNDYSDLNEDGSLDIGYKPAAIDYYGYFDSYNCYAYSNGEFIPVGARKSTTSRENKKCGRAAGQWSGDFLNYVTTSRMDALRKVLYGGYRYVDTADRTVLERVFIPQDAHAWGKEYQSESRDGYDIRDYAPLDLPETGKYHLFANVTLTGVGSPPLMRVLANTAYRVWEWVSIERPVAGTQCATGANNRADCVGGSSRYESHPADHAEFETLVSEFANDAHKQGTQDVANIDGSGNPFGTDDYYLTVFKGELDIATGGTYQFAVDGDDAVEVIIDGTVVAGWYGGHGACNCQTHSGTITLSAGEHSIEFRQQETTGGDNYYLWWNGADSGNAWQIVPASGFDGLKQTVYNVQRGGAATMTDYTVRVEVCKPGYEEPNCQAYSGTSAQKPTGLLHKYGEGNGMFFGMIGGSYANNTQGGVLRKNISSIDDEINTNGTFKCAGSNSACTTPGIVGTIDRLRITSFNYANHEYSCGWITTRQMNNGECEMWGNPLGEMVYETVRYFAGKATPTSDFNYSTGPDVTLGLPKATWKDPYNTTDGFPYCAKPYMLAISDVYPSFDSDKVPGSFFSAFSGDISELNAANVGQSIWNIEFGSGTTKKVFIGRSGATDDSAPTAKDATSFGNLRGLAPGEPTREGSFSAAEVAYYARLNNLNPIAAARSTEIRMSAFSVALSSPFPTIEIPIERNADGTVARKVTLVPFAKSDWGCLGLDGSTAALDGTGFRPTNQIVDFYVESISDQDGDAATCVSSGKCPKYVFRINYEDVEQGADHDMDAIVKYTVELVNDNGTAKVKVNLSSDYAAGCIHHHMGYVISGTTDDGIYLDVRDLDTAAANDRDYFLDTPDATNLPYPRNAATYKDATALPLSRTRLFVASTQADQSAILLKDPLWYAAKYGGFKDINSNGVLDGNEWDTNGDGIPDNYFLVVNPLKLEQQLGGALDKIKHDASTFATLATNSTSLQEGSTLYQARFSAVGWRGELYAFPIDPNGALGTARWEAHKLLNVGDARQILTYDPDAASVKGIPFQFNSMTSGGVLQTSLNTAIGGTTDSCGDERLSWLRGANPPTCAGIQFRTREKIPGTDQDSVLGDIINSAIQYVGPPSFGYGLTGYTEFRNTWKDRKAMIYVGANDGILHGFSACLANGTCTDAGTEAIGYVPSEMYRLRPAGTGSPVHRLSKLTEPNYGTGGNPHAFYVDGTPTVGDVCNTSCASGSDWKTILVGGLNGGGQGIYALNITNPGAYGDEANAGSLVMWEFNDWHDDASISDNASDTTMTYGLGYTYSRPAVVRICTTRSSSSTSTPKVCSTSQWVVIFGNGYNNSEADTHPQSSVTATASTSGYAMLYVLDALSGQVIRKINTKAGNTVSPNGLATVAPDDADGDGVVDYVYAGDLKGNMWKFDLSGATSSWSVAYQSAGLPAPFYNAKDTSGNEQPITTSPEIIGHPDGGAVILFGTGKYLEAGTDPSSDRQQTFYGIRDNGAAVSTQTDRSNLQQQRVYNQVTNDATVQSNLRSSTQSAIDWTTKAGWYMDLARTANVPSERVIFDPKLFGSILYFPTAIPSGDVCAFGGTSWDYFLDAVTGGSLTFSPFLGVNKINTGDVSVPMAFASSRESRVGLSPTGTIIGTGRGSGLLFKTGTGGDGTGGLDTVRKTCKDAAGNGYDCKTGIPISLGTNAGRRVSWRELNFD